MNTTDKQQTVEEVFALYAEYGQADYIGEPVSQIEHMSQAAQLAMASGADDEVVLAAFFHDIGHICAMDAPQESMDGWGTKSHEKIGADYLRAKGFSENIAQMVENHVEAKRYLTFKYPEYFEQLSEASKQTLTYQGGVMSAEEAYTFEQQPLFAWSIQLRKWDELAKEEHTPLINLEILKEMCIRHLEHNR